MPGNPHAIRVGANVRAEMARNKISQKSLAERLPKPLKITQQKLSRCLSGDQAFRVDELQAIADELGVSVATLLQDSTAVSA